MRSSLWLAAWVWGWALLYHCQGCGGEPGDLFAPAFSRAMVGDADSQESGQDAPGSGGGANPQGGAAGASGGALGGAGGGSGGQPEPGADPGPEPPAEAGMGDATCWPDGCPCPCYRNAAMDAHCPHGDRHHAFVCAGCAPAGCAFEYDAQASMACCP